MKNLLSMLVATLLIGFSVPARGAEDGIVRLTVRIIRIPAEQSFHGEVPDGRGGRISLQAAGNILTGFPRGTIFIPTELAQNASDSAIGRAIGEHVAFRCGDIAADRLLTGELKSFDFELKRGRPGQEARFEVSRGEGKTSNYELRAELLSDGPGTAVIRIRFWAGWSAMAGSMGVGFSEDVISAVADVPESRLLLIGAPGDRAVYFLAVCAQPR